MLDESQRVATNPKSQISTWLAKLGYSESNLVNISYRNFGLSIHSRSISKDDSQIKVFVRENIYTDLDRTASEAILEKFGTVILKDPNYNIISFASPKS